MDVALRCLPQQSNQLDTLELPPSVRRGRARERRAAIYINVVSRSLTKEWNEFDLIELDRIGNEKKGQDRFCIVCLV